MPKRSPSSATTFVEFAAPPGRSAFDVALSLVAAICTAEGATVRSADVVDSTNARFVIHIPVPSVEA